MGGLYAGLASPLIGQMIFRSTISCPRDFKSLVCREGSNGEQDVFRFFIAGAMTGAVISPVETPIDVIIADAEGESDRIDCW